MARKDQPYLPLFVQDFATDEKLMECSAAATGVYIRIMCVLHKSDPYGGILLKQKHKQSDNQISNFASLFAKHLPYDLLTICSGLDELISEGCLQIDGDFLFQKRMLEDGELSLKRSKSGQTGGLVTQEKAHNFAKAKLKANKQANSEIEIENVLYSNPQKEEEEEEEIENAHEEKKLEKNSDPPEISKNKKSINGSKILAAAPDLTPAWTDFVVPVTKEKSVIVSYATNGNHNCQELLQWWGSIEFQLCVAQCGIRDSNENYLAFVLSEFASMIATDDECHRKKFAFRLKTFLSSRSTALLKTFNQKQNTLSKFNEDLEKISGIPPDTKKSFREYYTRIQPAGNYYFEQRNNFVVAEEIKTWSLTHQTKSNGKHIPNTSKVGREIVFDKL